MTTSFCVAGGASGKTSISEPIHDVLFHILKHQKADRRCHQGKGETVDPFIPGECDALEQRRAESHQHAHGWVQRVDALRCLWQHRGIVYYWRDKQADI